MKKINHVNEENKSYQIKSFFEISSILSWKKIEENFLVDTLYVQWVTEWQIQTLKLLISVIIEERHLICGGSVIYETSKNKIER